MGKKSMSNRNQGRHGKRDWRQDPNKQTTLSLSEYTGKPVRYYTLERPDSKFVGFYIFDYDKTNLQHMEVLAKFLKMVVGEYKSIGYDSLSTAEWLYGNPFTPPFTDKAGYNSEKKGCQEFYKLNVKHKEMNMYGPK